jgi:hypothetical protein
MREMTMSHMAQAMQDKLLDLSDSSDVYALLASLPGAASPAPP